jgi:hypothetical protein
MANAHVHTDETGRILEISHDGAKILNVTGRGGYGRQLAHFIVHDRNKLVEQIEIAARGHAVTFATTFRPLERAPRGVVLRICRVLDAPVELAWSFELSGAQRVPRTRRTHDAA